MPGSGAGGVDVLHSSNRIVETLLVLLVVLVFFVLFTAILFQLFPSGIGLKHLFGPAQQIDLSTQKNTTSVANGEPGRPPLAAKLVRSVNEVKSKGGNSISWEKANEGMALYDNDAVQTQANSTADISFDSKNTLQLGGKTLVVIKKIEKNPFSDHRRASMVVVVGGQIAGRIASDAIEIAIPNAVARLNGGTQIDKAAVFKLLVNPDQSSSLAMLNGVGEISSEGRTVLIPENKGVKLRPGQEPEVVDLPAPPRTRSPAENQVETFRELPPQMQFTWQALSQTQYQFSLAKDREFTDMVMDKTLDQPRFDHGNLQAGVYFWRVSSIRDGMQGRPGKVARLELIKKMAPPELQVNFPTGAVVTARFKVRGISSPSASIYINNDPVAMDAQGKFVSDVSLRPGMNLVTVEAVDNVGNSTYRSAYIEGRF